ncbi:hypothetical protein [Pleionea sediminis]|uniref:hypothetical protein n=1 Tax=Pleionea sediminis TaxID=2569479 RepID=UPI001185647F|nr:hypothetical protein [Pleionea sediminis]
MNKSASVLSLAIVSLILFSIGYMYLGSTRDFEQYELIRGYFLSSKENSNFYVCDNSVSWSGAYTFSDAFSKQKLLEKYLLLTDGEIKPIYYELMGKIEYSSRSGYSEISFPSKIYVDKVKLALDLKNELCPYPEVLLDMGFNN